MNKYMSCESSRFLFLQHHMFPHPSSAEPEDKPAASSTDVYLSFIWCDSEWPMTAEVSF